MYHVGCSVTEMHANMQILASMSRVPQTSLFDTPDEKPKQLLFQKYNCPARQDSHVQSLSAAMLTVVRYFRSMNFWIKSEPQLLLHLHMCA